MTGGECTFTGLTADELYYAGAEIEGEWAYVGFLPVDPVESVEDFALAGDVVGTPAATLLSDDITSQRSLIAEGGVSVGDTVKVLRQTSLTADLDAFELVSADYPAPAGKALYLALSALVVISATAPDIGASLFVTLDPMDSVSGEVPTYGAAVGTLTLSGPLAGDSINRTRHTNAEAFAAPADGAYALRAVSDDTAGASFNVRARLWGFFQ
jgi:hypothetical protein